MRIMILEDDPNTRRCLVSCLKSQYAVDAFATIADAELPALTEPYDLYIFDLMLPDGKGSTLAMRMRQEQQNAPIIVLTGQQSSSEKIHAFDVCGVDEYLVKPFSAEELLARVHQLMGRQMIRHTHTVHCGTLTFDERRYRMCSQNTPLTLQRKDIQILEYLMKHQGRLVSKQEIIDHVWSMDACVRDNTFDVHMKAIRKALKRHRSDRLLRTFRGMGYLLEAHP